MRAYTYTLTKSKCKLLFSQQSICPASASLRFRFLFASPLLPPGLPCTPTVILLALPLVPFKVIPLPTRFRVRPSANTFLHCPSSSPLLLVVLRLLFKGCSLLDSYGYDHDYFLSTIVITFKNNVIHIPSIIYIAIRIATFVFL